ncbi:hypothetical protein PYCCODRAFT_1471504 [Trametes coccinea BRFM310]|uniref:Uncharacterized protein n=1 Tax=Trametes coccinea (strain BRFM310) TaxID=1353009 RepID=A0A1Y2IBQ8_TRAC3|nr:hypothetical protein PYCCODRAFT_1471504 [Trametes coccinea BRFM310]
MPPPLRLKDLVFASFALLIPSSATRLCSPNRTCFTQPPHSHSSPFPPTCLITMSASTATKSTAAKGKKATTPAQLCAAAREEVNTLFASASRGSIAGEEEYSSQAIIGGREYTEEVAYQAVRLVRETAGSATGVEGEDVDENIPWMHPLYHQAFTQVQAEAAAERAEHEEAERADRKGKEEAPASVAEVETEVGGVGAEVDELVDNDVEIVEEPHPATRTRSQRKVTPRPIHVPQHKPAVKVVVSKLKRALPADEGCRAFAQEEGPDRDPHLPCASLAAHVRRAFPLHLRKFAISLESCASFTNLAQCAYCAAHPGGGRCMLREGFSKCDRCLLGRQGCWALGGGRKPFGDWYDGKAHSRAVRLDGIIAAKVIRLRGWSSDMPGWVKEAWEEYKSARKALHTAGEGSLGESTASEGSRPPSAKLAKAAVPARTTKGTPSASAGSSKLSHVEISAPRVRVAGPVGPSSSSQPTAPSSSSSQPTAPTSLWAIPPPSSLATPPTSHLPPPAPPRVASPIDALCPPSVPPFAAEAPL